MKKYLPLTLRIIVAVILIQTLRFKFTAHPDSVFIFETVGLEPFGRISIGILELIASILLILPKTIWAGAILSIGLMSGAIFLHLTKLGIEVQNDGGILFITAVITFTFSVIILFIYKKDIPIIGSKFS